MSIRSFLFGKGIIKGKPLIDADNELRAFYSGEIEQWKEIYGGGGDWRYVSKGGINGGMRRMASLGAAKALCRELSDLCFSEQVDFSFSDKRVSEYVKDTLDENGFWDMFPDFLEKMFALGGGVIKVSYDNGVKLGFISCDDFFPTQWENGRIYGGAMITYIKRGDKRYALVERHEFEKRGYVITNTLFRCDSSITSGVPVQLSDVFPELAEETVIEGIDKPLFVYFRTNSANNLDFGNADNVLGISAFANATDTLKSLDVVFDSLQREFILGKKRIIVPTSAVRGEYDENGNLKKYFDVNDEVFQAFSENDSDDLRITDNSVQLRIEEHIKALDELLNLLCMQSGLSAGTLSYKTGTIKTATEVISSNSKTHRTKQAQQRLLAEELAQLTENIALLGKMSGDIPESADTGVVIQFGDNIAVDTNTKIDNAIKLFNAGLIGKTRALMDIYGLSEEEARALE